MVRQLPWKVNGGSKPAPKRATPSSLAPASPAPAERSHTSSAARAKSGTPVSVGGKSRRSLTAKLDRSPSTSPPPQPLSEEFMIEGFDADDRYRMVEDEFLAMAGSFTKHLHAAEYQRLKDMASSRNADVIRTISRPVTGRMTDLVKKRQTALALAASQRKGLKNTLGKRKGRELSDTDDDGDLPWAGTSLQGLMESPRKKAVMLPVASSATTASAFGLGSSRSGGRLESRDTRPGTATESDEDEDDLDTQPRFSTRVGGLKRSASSSVSINKKATSIEAMSRRHEPSLPSYGGDSTRSTTVANSDRTSSASYRSEQHRATTTVRSGRASTSTSVPAPADGSDDEDDFIARMRKRREQQEQRRQREKSSTGEKSKDRSLVDAIPIPFS